MKRHLPNIAGSILGLLFILASLVVLLHLGPVPKVPSGTPIAHFQEAFMPTGYMTFVKIFELLGGVLVAIPRTRNLGLLVLGPIIVNILAFSIFITRGEGLVNPMLLIIVGLAAYLLWVERKAFACLIRIPSMRQGPEQGGGAGILG